jgi:hypothetical protein
VAAGDPVQQRQAPLDVAQRREVHVADQVDLVRLLERASVAGVNVFGVSTTT